MPSVHDIRRATLALQRELEREAPDVERVRALWRELHPVLLISIAGAEMAHELEGELPAHVVQMFERAASDAVIDATLATLPDESFGIPELEPPCHCDVPLRIEPPYLKCPRCGARRMQRTLHGGN